MKVLVISVLLSLIAYTKWEKVAIDGPEPRYINQLVFANHSLLLFGGKNSSSNGFDDLWEWRDGKWTLLGNGATKRWDHSYVYMSNLDQLFLFGGRTFQDVQGKEERVDLNDSWTYKNKQWEVLPIDGPEPRSSHGLVFYATENRVILFGGRNQGKIFDDTWTFDGTSWSRLNVQGPSKRYGHSLAYDPTSQTVFLFGGFDGEKLLKDLWAFEEGRWTEIETEKKPSPRMAHAMQFDDKGTAVLFGGWDESNALSGDLWIWANGKWRISNTDNMPQARLSCAIGYDGKQDAFILFGGSTGFNGTFLAETWELRL